MRIRDPEGKPVRPGETGELMIKGIRGLSIFREYDGDAAATFAAFDADGFFRTGDRVTLLDDSWIKFGDRANDVIKVGGEGVSPSEIEVVIRGVKGVREMSRSWVRKMMLMGRYRSPLWRLMLNLDAISKVQFWRGVARRSQNSKSLGVWSLFPSTRAWEMRRSQKPSCVRCFK